MSVATVRAGLALMLTNAGYGVNEQVSPYLLTSPSPPCFDMVFNGTTYDIAMRRGIVRHEFIVRLRVPAVHDVGAQMMLDPYLEAVKIAIEAGKTDNPPTALGGAAVSVDVTGTSGLKEYQAVAVDGQPVTIMFGHEWTVEVWA